MIKLKEILPYCLVAKENNSSIISNVNEPVIFNSDRGRMRVFYLKDDLCAHTPYTLVNGRMPKRILWDRNNIGLPIHFYTHSNIFENNYCGKKRYAMLFESESVTVKDYERAMNLTEQMQEYDCIFTHSEKILNKYTNAKFVPASGVWYGTEENGGTFDSERYAKKEKNISIVCSSKTITDMQKVRHRIADIVKKDKSVDGYGNYFDNYIEKKSQSLDDYRFSIVVENDITPFYFTEKILDCFASMTIPIYIGATKIGDFFNEDGIIKVGINEIENIPQIIKKCDKNLYNERLKYVIENYNRVNKYICIEDYLIDNYENMF